METLTMSGKERERVSVMVGVAERKLTLVQASEVMGVVLPPEQADLETIAGLR
jgi:hypothetical protein